MEDLSKHSENIEDRDLDIKQSDSYVPIPDDSKAPALRHQHEDLQKYKLLFEFAPDAIFIGDVESGIILEANQSAAELLGIPVEQIIGMHQWQLHPADEAQRYQKIFQNHIQKGRAIFSDNIYVCRKDGRKIPIQINATVTQIGDKQIIYGIFRDITELKQLMEDIKASETRFHRLSEAAFEAIVIHQNGTIIDVNQRCLNMFGYTFDEVKQISKLEMIAPESRKLVEEKLASKFEDAYEAFGQKKDGTIFPVLIQAKETFLSGQPIRIGTIRDMTNQLRQEQLFKTVFESSHESIIVFDQACNHLYANQAALDYVNLPREKVVGSNVLNVWPNDPDFAKQWTHRIKETFKTGKSSRFEDTNSIAGQPVFSESEISPIRYPGGEIFAVSIVYHNVTEKKQLQQKLKDSEQRYRDLYDNSHVALLRTAFDSTLLDCNRATATLFGFPQDQPVESILGTFHLQDQYVDITQRQQMIELLEKKGEVHDFEVKFKRIDGTTFWGSVSIRLMRESGYYDGAICDVSTHKILSKTEKKVLDYLMQGKSNKEIARELRRSVRTIEDHRAHIMRKLGVDNLVDLTQKVLNLHNHYMEE